jgi:hypothetical protein
MRSCNTQIVESTLLFGIFLTGIRPEMFRFAQFATGRIRRGGHDSGICKSSKPVTLTGAV